MMTRLNSRIGMFLIAAFLAGCASSGKEFDTTRIDSIKIGVQDKSTIKEWLGQPQQMTTLTGNPKHCVERWIYVYAHAVGFGTVTKAESLVVDFDKNDKVCDKAYSKQK
jgi:hypothetical protein